MSTLHDEIHNDPAGKGYMSFLPESPGTVADMLNALTETMVKSRMLTDRGILSSVGLGADAGDAFLTKLDAIAASGVAGTGPLKRVLKHLYSADGIDIGDSETLAKLEALVGVAGVTQAEADAVKAISLKPASRMEKLGLPPATIPDVIGAL